jgi:hypothetical protein
METPISKIPIINGDCNFYNSDLRGELIFKNAKFKEPSTQEKAFRKAKIVWGELGDREEADYYFYREMEAKRLQKPYYSDTQSG